MRGRRTALPAALLLLLLAPAQALAHGFQQRANLPIPEWLFGWAAAVVLVVSFVALAVLWSKPVLENAQPKPGDGTALGRALASAPVQVLCGAIGVFLLGVTIWSASAGSDVPENNWAPTFVFIWFWVGLVLASIVFGDVFRAFNPWRAIGRVLFRRARVPYPDRLGRWPAVLGIAGFTVLELVFVGGTEVRILATAMIAYTVITLAGMAVFGWEAWSDRAEAFGVYFGFFARIAPFEARDGAVRTRLPLSALTRLDNQAGTVALVMVAIGSVSFDGLSSGGVWRNTFQPKLFDFFDGLGPTAGERLANLLGLLVCVGLVAGFYRLGIAGMRSVGGNFEARDLRFRFVHTLVPIAVVYVMAHYLTLLIFEGQGIVYLASDPLGKGWDLFGTADRAIDFSVLSQNAVWYLQVGFVVAGHVAGLALAHDRALALYSNPRLAVRSQYWMLAIMVGFTSLALWLLAQAGA